MGSSHSRTHVVPDGEPYHNEGTPYEIKVTIGLLIAITLVVGIALCAIGGVYVNNSYGCPDGTTQTFNEPSHDTFTCKMPSGTDISPIKVQSETGVVLIIFGCCLGFVSAALFIGLMMR
jgi:hypothetical protein